MRRRAAYHSALHEPVGCTPLNTFASPRIEAFRWDIMSERGRMPVNFDCCQLFYSELPWRQGFDKFNERAGIAQEHRPTYDDFCRRVHELCMSVTWPVILITGYREAKAWPKVAGMLQGDVTLNGAPACATVYREDMYNGCAPRPGEDVQDWLARLARFPLLPDCVGDFCCGYGRAGRIFLEAGKRAVLSDYNPECIGYIAANAHLWVARP